jgi:hypothetical protein
MSGVHHQYAIRQSFAAVSWRGQLRARPTIQILEDRTLLSFNAPLTLPTDVSPEGLVAADLTGNGILDLVVANQGFSADGTFRAVSILLGNGDGSFQPARNIDIGPFPFAVAVGDFNGDGTPDLAVTHAEPLASNLDTVSILLGNGDGTFRAAGDLQVGMDPRAVAVGDFRGDGKLDLVTANASDGTVSILQGNGDGTFQTAVTLPVGPIPDGVAVGNFNGNLGIVTADEGDVFGNGGGVSVLLGNGDGSFQPAVNYDLGNAGSRPAARGVAVADLTGSGIPDLVTGNGSDDGSTVSVFLGSGDGTFQSAVAYPVVPVDSRIAISSVLSVGVGNFDGQQDIVVGNGSLLQNAGGELSQLFLLPGNGDGTFRAPVGINTGPLPAGLAVGQFTSDGNLDVAVDSVSGGDVIIFLGHGDGTFNNAPEFPAGAGAISIAQADFTGSGIRDLVTANTSDDTISVLFGNGDGTFQAPVTYAVGHFPEFVATADLTGNGIQDIIVATTGTGTHGTLSVFLGNGDGTFQAPITIDPGLQIFFPRSMAVGEFDGDGIPDLAISYDGPAGEAAVLVLAGNGNGTFRQLSNVVFGNLSSAGRLAVADVNGDGNDDLLLPADSVNSGGVEVLLGNGNGTFRDTGLTPTTVGGASAVAVGDFGNGFPDLAVTNFLSNTVSVFLGNGSGLFLQAPVNYTIGGNPRSVLVADLEGGGILDIVTASSTGSTVSVLRGNGDGTFESEIRYLSGAGTNAVVAGDFNGDGARDLATANGVSGTVSVLLNRNDGTGPAGPRAGHTSTVRVAALDTVFAGTRPEPASPVVARPPSAEVTVAAAFASGPMAATNPLQAPPTTAEGILVRRRQVDAADGAGLADPLTADLVGVV